MKQELSKPIRQRSGNRGVLLTVAFAIALIAATLLISKDSEACCFYNNANDDIAVSFNCGWFCGNKWTIDPNEHKCRPGKGGIATIKHAGEWDHCDIEVAKHGWVEVTHVAKKGVVVSKDENGNTTRTCTFDWHNDKPTPVH